MLLEGAGDDISIYGLKCPPWSPNRNAIAFVFLHHEPMIMDIVLTDISTLLPGLLRLHA